jgi:hypothetical protein
VKSGALRAEVVSTETESKRHRLHGLVTSQPFTTAIVGQRNGNAMDHKNTSAELRIRIAKYRALARLSTDQDTAQRIHELADELEVKLREMQASDDESLQGPN